MSSVRAPLKEYEMDGHARLAVLVAPGILVAGIFGLKNWYDNQQAEIAAQETSIVASLEALGVKDPHEVDGKDKYHGTVGNCNTIIWAEEDEAQFRVATGPGLLGPTMRLIAVVDLDGGLTIAEVEEFYNVGCFDDH